MSITASFWIFFIPLSIVISFVSAEYTWPSAQHDALEQFLYEGTHVTGDNVAGLARFCLPRFLPGGDQPSSVAAEWVRLAYHDMATHNATDGTGGLDGSIFYELDRPENVGAGNVNTVGDFKDHSSKLVSRSDIIAMGAVWAVAACGGPPIPFRYGRKDALKAGRSGVPEPQQNLASHIESFRLQGFTQKEMIGLVACGHTLGGVRGVDFQDIVPDPSISSIATFDTTSGLDSAFDHLIVTQYLNSSTQNPLIRVPSGNSTFASDLRIFSSDQNATMKGLNSETSFSQTCTTLLAKMIDTVPSNVHLSDVVTLLPVKVSNAQITAIDSQLVFMTDLRVAFPAGISPTAASKVQMFWCDSRGVFKNCNRVTNVASLPFLDEPSTSPLTDSLNIQLVLYRFKVQISASRSVSKFWFEIDGAIHNNGGNGYPIGQDEIIFVPSLGSVDPKFLQPDPANPSEFLPRNYNLVFGVSVTPLITNEFILIVIYCR
ncbi:hypothetical protein GALMADRAFT_95393 [Galerina marginata CBS 339.88]|uniref:Peroxidase n=1 Tax=Galerina marginata (strain CBS 339.88) TaxID=685588 RepID=A0A067TFF7_GALM3|nr:hypothetical protein GALMADRAFT_95393 [Galerina marginata CBS 339.88]